MANIEDEDYAVKPLNKSEEFERFEKKGLAICVPTYNRQGIIMEMLDAELSMLSKHDVDIYIYDSSEGSATEDIVNEFKKAGYANLYYKRAASAVHANEKVYMIYKDMENSDYKYVWMIRDRDTISEEALAYVQKCLSADIPIYWVNVSQKEYGIYKLNDINEFLVQASYELLRFGAVILKVPDFIRGSRWAYFDKKYINKKKIHASHVGYYFERCAELELFEACRIDLPKSAMSDKTTDRSWENHRLQIAVECWGSVIWGLPKRYTRRRDAMHSLYQGHLNKITILGKKSDGNYGIFEFIKYGKWFRRIRPENYFFYLAAALLPLKMVKTIYFYNFMKQFANTYPYIYGAGRLGNECGEFLDILGIEYKGYLVNSMEQNPETKRKHPVTAAREVLQGETATIIIAVLLQENDIKRIGENLIRMNGADTLQIIDYNKIRV